MAKEKNPDSPVQRALPFNYELAQIESQSSLNTKTRKQLKVRKNDESAKKRDPKVPVGKINISVAEIKMAKDLEENQLEVAFSYLLLLQAMVNEGQIPNTPEELQQALHGIQRLTIYSSPEITPPYITNNNQTEDSADFSLPLQIAFVSELLRGPFKNFEPTKTFPQISFSELSTYYNIFLSLFTNFSFDPSSHPQQSLSLQRATETGITLHALDALFDACRIDDIERHDPFPTNFDLSSSFDRISPHLRSSLFPSEQEYRSWHERIIRDIQQQELSKAKGNLNNYNIWRDEPNDILTSSYNLSNHWIRHSLEPIRNTRVYRELDTIMLLGGNPRSAYPLGISMFTRYDAIYSTVPTGFSQFSGEKPSYMMFDLKVRRDIHRAPTDSVKREIELRSNALLRYLCQAFLGSYHVKNRLIIPQQLSNEKKTPYITKVTFPTQTDLSLSTELRLFNPDTGDTRKSPIEMNNDEIQWMNVWLTRVIIPFIHLFDSIDSDLESLHKLVS